MKYDTNFKSVKDQVSPDEWAARVELAACYRLIDQYGMTDLIYNHVTSRIPGTEHLLINLYGLLYKEITASSLVKIDVEGNPVGPSTHPVNPAGFTIHSAIHMAREDAAAEVTETEAPEHPAAQAYLRLARELVARVHAVLRRMRPALAGETLRFGDVEMDTVAHKVKRAGEIVALGPTEYRLLKHFLEHPGWVFSRERLLDAVWGHDSDIEARTVRLVERALERFAL